MAEQRRVQLAVPEELAKKIAALAMTRRTKSATLIKQVLNEFLERNAEEVAEAVEFYNNYQKSLEKFRERNSD